MYSIPPAVVSKPAPAAPSFALELLSAVPPRSEVVEAYWLGFDLAGDGIPAEPGPDYGPAELAAFRRGVDDGAERWHRETCDAAERLYAEMAEEAREREGVYFAY